MIQFLNNIYTSMLLLLQAYPQIPVLAVIPELLQQSNGHDYGYRQKEGSHQ